MKNEIRNILREQFREQISDQLKAVALKNLIGREFAEMFYSHEQMERVKELNAAMQRAAAHHIDYSSLNVEKQIIYQSADSKESLKILDAKFAMNWIKNRDILMLYVEKEKYDRINRSVSWTVAEVQKFLNKYFNIPLLKGRIQLFPA